MKELLLLLLLASFRANAGDMVLPVIAVQDGDTIETRLTLPEPLDKISIRVFGIDTPEKPAASYTETGKLGLAKCKKEADLALKAKEVVTSLVSRGGNTIYTRGMQWDKYGGRIDADVYVKVNGQNIDIARTLIEGGYAIEYFGEKKTHDWCQ